MDFFEKNLKYFFFFKEMKLEEEVKCEKTDIEAVNHVFLFEQHFSCLIIFPFSEDYLLAAFYNSIPIFAFFWGENTIFHVTFCSKNKPCSRIIRLLFNFFCYLNDPLKQGLSSFFLGVWLRTFFLFVTSSGTRTPSWEMLL